MMQVGIGENRYLINTEEAQYNQALEELSLQFVNYYREMESRGYVDKRLKSIMK